MTQNTPMETETAKTTPILETAWKRVAVLDDMAKRRSAAHSRTRAVIAILGVLATFFAILTQLIQPEQNARIPALAGLAAKAFFVAIPAVASALAAFASKKYSNADWLITRAGAEEIQKEIYFYRTILQKKKNRRLYLEKRLARIQRQIYRGLNGEFSFDTYSGRVPPNYDSNDPNSDPGYADLTGEEYFRYRLQDQLQWHNRKINQYKAERDRWTMYILASGVLGTILAAWGEVPNGPSLSIWVALTASITAAFLGWQELRNIDAIIRNYSKVVLELTVLQDHWVNLQPEERTRAEFYKLVKNCERVLWAQNTEYIKSMQEALKDSSLEEESSFVNKAVDESVESAKRTKRAVREKLLEHTRKVREEGEEMVVEKFEAALGTLAKEASSELVQQELEAMRRAATDAFENVKDRAASFVDSITQVKEEYAHVEISKDTTMEELNTILAKYPKTNDVKG